MEGFLTPVLPGCRWLQEHHSAASRTKFELTVGELHLALDVYIILQQVHVESTTTILIRYML